MDAQNAVQLVIWKLWEYLDINRKKYFLSTNKLSPYPFRNIITDLIVM